MEADTSANKYLEAEISAGTLLSKHNGWITLDSNNMARKKAPEKF